MNLKKGLVVLAILLVCNGCVSQKIKNHLEGYGYTCDRNECYLEQNVDIDNDEQQYVSTRTTIFDFDNNAFITTFAQVNVVNGQVQPDTGGYQFRYYWDTNNAYASSVILNEEYYYDCNTTKIEYRLYNNVESTASCLNLNGNNPYYNDFNYYCHMLMAACIYDQASFNKLTDDGYLLK